MYIVRFKTRKRHVPEVRTFHTAIAVAEWTEKHPFDVTEIVMYADIPLNGTRIESCRLAVYKGCTFDTDGKIRFHRELDENMTPLVVAWSRRNHK